MIVSSGFQGEMSAFLAQRARPILATTSAEQQCFPSTYPQIDRTWMQGFPHCPQISDELLLLYSQHLARRSQDQHGTSRSGQFVDIGGSTRIQSCGFAPDRRAPEGGSQ